LTAFVYTFATGPFIEKGLNRLDLLNESCIMLLTYLTIPYSDYLSDPYFKFKMGWLAIGVSAISFLSNLIFIIATVSIKVKKLICIHIKKAK